MALVYFTFGHCIVCSLIYGFGIFFFWPLYCLSFDLWLWHIFLLAIDTKAINQRTDNTMAKSKIYQSHKSKDRQYNGQKKKIPKP
jgi:hypothetical protein